MKYDYWEWSNFLNKEEIQKINNFLKNSSFDDEPEFCAARSDGKKKKLQNHKIERRTLNQTHLDIFFK
jgi:hypothetical protein